MVVVLLDTERAQRDRDEAEWERDEPGEIDGEIRETGSREKRMRERGRRRGGSGTHGGVHVIFLFE